MEDELLRLFGGERMMAIVQRMGIEEDEAIQTRMITRSIENAQKKVEGKNFGIRKYVLQYDNVMNKQREIIYGERKKVLLGENLRDYIENMTDELIENIITPITLDSKYPEEWDFDVMVRNLRQISARFGGIDTSKESLANMRRFFPNMAHPQNPSFLILYRHQNEKKKDEDGNVLGVYNGG